MNKIKIIEATGPVLDWLVATLESSDGRIVKLGGGWNGSFYVERENGPDCGVFHRHSASTDWAQGGPIIEREGIDVGPYLSGESRWSAKKKDSYEKAPTPLIAAMRCYVASKLGDEVEVPKELLV